MRTAGGQLTDGAMSYEHLINLADGISIGVCLFCANLLLMRRKDRGIYVPLALFFLAVAIPDIPDAVIRDQDTAGRMLSALYINIFLAPLTFAVPFLFWTYVRALTTEGEPGRVENKVYHFIPIIVISLCIVPVLLIPPDSLVDTNLNDADVPEGMLGLFLTAYLGLIAGDILFICLATFYLILIFKRLSIHRARLKDFFASTEARELNWIWLIMACFCGYLLFSILDTLLTNFELAPDIGESEQFALLMELLLLVLVWVIGLWGLRQRPIFVRVGAKERSEPPPAKKYEKSALDSERARRIASKIEAAMTDDLLYRDANLSLWDLSKHIGVTSHYVSQTLNGELGSSFFDYVNSWRIKDAVKQLETTDETILVIAYDVGFNSRSSFYKAFKNETGTTPSDLRK